MVGQYTATDADGDALAWQALTGADAPIFELVGTGAVRTLQFTAAPDFEAPTDQDLNNEYAASLAVSDGTATTTLAVTVTVHDVEEGGRSRLSRPHRRWMFC